MAAAQGKVIITCAVTGSIHTPTMSPHLPITPDEIAEAAIGAAKAGAAIVHLHARDPKDGRPTQDPERFRQFAREIEAESERVGDEGTSRGRHGKSVGGRQEAHAPDTQADDAVTDRAASEQWRAE